MTKEISIGKVTCNICGDTYYYSGNFTGQVSTDKENPDSLDDWVHEFTIDRPGYGSIFDGCGIKFHVCDDCLEKIFGGMKKKPLIDSYPPHKYSKSVQYVEQNYDVNIKNIDHEKFREMLNNINKESMR